MKNKILLTSILSFLYCLELNNFSNAENLEFKARNSLMRMEIKLLEIMMLLQK